jgi:hypothetical protein
VPRVPIAALRDGDDPRTERFSDLARPTTYKGGQALP